MIDLLKQQTPAGITQLLSSSDGSSPNQNVINALATLAQIIIRIFLCSCPQNPITCSVLTGVLIAATPCSVLGLLHANHPDQVPSCEFYTPSPAPLHTVTVPHVLPMQTVIQLLCTFTINMQGLSLQAHVIASNMQKTTPYFVSTMVLEDDKKQSGK
jgi:hypothetical protein